MPMSGLAPIDVSVVMTTYNRVDFLRRALDSLFQQETGGSFRHEIIVVDNASTDGTREVVEAMAAEVSVPLKYLMEDRWGVAHARNRGISESSGEWVAFFDDDQVAEPGWLRALFDLARRTRTPCVGGRIMLRLPPGESAPLSPAVRILLGETSHGDKPMRLSGKMLPGTGNVLIRKPLIEALGDFDESFSRGCEDADFFRRARRCSIPMWYAPRATAHHLIPPYRLRREYLLWTAARQGANYAYLDYKEKGLVKTVLASIARGGQALLVHLPGLLLSFLCMDKAEALGCRCLLARTAGYLRETLYRLGPSLFTQGNFFSALEFRKERDLFS